MNQTENLFKPAIKWDYYHYLRDRLTDYEDKGFSINIQLCVSNGKIFKQIYDGSNFFNFKESKYLYEAIRFAENGWFYLVKMTYENVPIIDILEYIYTRVEARFEMVGIEKHFLVLKQK